MSDSPNCGAGNSYDGRLGLRVGAIFILWASSSCAALFPVATKRWSKMAVRVPPSVFDVAKYAGSGVIIATAFIHLLAPAFAELGSPCLTGVWTEYDWAPAIAMCAVFAIFVVELAAFRWGTAKAAELAFRYDAHAHAVVGAHGPEAGSATCGDADARTGDIERGLEDEGEGGYRGGRENDGASLKKDAEADVGRAHDPHQHHHHHHYHDDVNDLTAVAKNSEPVWANVTSVMVLEFGVVFHSVIIGLTLAVTDAFNVLFVVIIFHQMFEGLGLGTRLAYLPASLGSLIPFTGALIYGLVTPVGMAIGLGVRTSYNPDSTTASIVSGVLDATSAGILLYTGLVELLAHEFIFNEGMRKAPASRVFLNVLEMLVGAGIMALLGRWA